MAPTALLLVLVLGDPAAVLDNTRATSTDADSIGFLEVGEPISLVELWGFARRASYESEKSARRIEEYAVIQGSVVASKMMFPDVWPPSLFPYGQYSLRVVRAEPVAVDLRMGEEADVVAMFPPTYKNGGVGGVSCSHCDDARVPISVGLDVIAIAFRSPKGRGHSYYHPELWPLFHVTFVVFQDRGGHWLMLVPDWGREYDVPTAAASGDSVPVPIEAWHGVTRRIEGSADEIFDHFVRAATDASEQ